MVTEMAIDENVPTRIPVNKAIEKPLKDSPAKNHMANMVASVVPEVIRVRTKVNLMALLIN